MTGGPEAALSWVSVTRGEGRTGENDAALELSTPLRSLPLPPKPVQGTVVGILRQQYEGGHRVVVPHTFVVRTCSRRSAPGRPAQAPEQRRRRQVAGRRSPGFDSERYKKRNVVERAISKLKQFRAVATRYDKRNLCLGAVTAAAVIIWLPT